MADVDESVSVLVEKSVLDKDDLLFLIDNPTGSAKGKKCTSSNTFNAAGISAITTDIKTHRVNDGINKTEYPLLYPEYIDFTDTDANLIDFDSVCIHGKYAYLCGAFTSYVIGVNLEDFSTLTFHDLLSTHADLKGFEGIFVDGRWLYLVPSVGQSALGRAARIFLRNFTTIATFLISGVDNNLKYFSGGFIGYNCKYIYYSPYEHGWIGRVEQSDFSTTAYLDLASAKSELTGARFIGCFSDGVYSYHVPYEGDTDYYFVRVELSTFGGSSVDILDLTETDNRLRGFWGGFTDGRYGYLVPESNAVTGEHGLFTRIDLEDFSTVDFIDLTETNGNLKLFHGGCTDGRYAYLMGGYGYIARVDLLDFSTVDYLDLSSLAPSGFGGCAADGRYLYFSSFNGLFFRIPLHKFASGGI